MIQFFFLKQRKAAVSIIVVAAFTCLSAAEVIARQTTSAGKQDTLQNGILLPAIWPPRSEEPLSEGPMRVPYLENPPAVIPIHKGRQLFVDDFLIASTDMQRVYHQASKYGANPVFFPSTKEELAGIFDNSATTYLGQGGVFFDPAARHFKMFYTAGWRGGLAMATSKDLVNWERPSLGLAGGNIIIPPGATVCRW